VSVHRALVRAYRDRCYLMPGDLCEYDGEPEWMFEPIDKGEHRAWLETAADPRRVAEVNWLDENRVGHPGADLHPDVAEHTLRAKWEAYSA
jgi:hypothetical protein